MTLPYTNADMFFTCSMILTGKQFEILGYDFKNTYFNQLLNENFEKRDVLRFFERIYHPDTLQKYWG